LSGRIEQAGRRGSLRRQVRKRETRDEEHGREHARRARQEIRRAARAENRSRRAGAEPRAGLGAFAALQKHEADDHDRDDQVNT